MWGRSAAGDGDGEWVGGGAARRGGGDLDPARRGEARWVSGFRCREGRGRSGERRAHSVVVDW